MTLAPGSVLWLLKHEMRVAWRGAMSRGMTGRKARNPIVSWIIIGVALALLTAFPGMLLGTFLSGKFYGPPAPIVILALDGICAVAFTLMLAQTLSAATIAFYERGDLDLLLSSPLSASRLLAVRALAIGANAAILFVVILSPFLVPIAVMGHWPWLAAYLVIASLALLAASAGITLAMMLFAVLGPRRTRTVAQVMAAVIGGAFFLTSQIGNLTGHSRTRGIGQLYARWAKGDHVGIPVSSPLALPARAAMGDPVPLLIVVAIALAIFTLMARSLGARFAVNAAAASGTPGKKRSAKAQAIPLPSFNQSLFGALVRKELKLLRRDATLISQVLLQAIYMIPLAFIMVSNARNKQAFLVATGAAAVVFLAGQIAASLGWVTISAEDAPDLLACAPAPVLQLRQAKLAAVLIPVFGLVAIPVAALAWFSPWTGVVVVLGVGSAATASGLIELWRQRPGKRSNFRMRAKGSVIILLVEMAAGMFFAGATALAAMKLIWALIPLLLGVGVVFLMRPPRSERAYVLADA